MNDHFVVRDFLTVLLAARYWHDDVAIPDEDLVGDVVTLNVADLKKRYPHVWERSVRICGG